MMKRKRRFSFLKLPHSMTYIRSLHWIIQNYLKIDLQVQNFTTHWKKHVGVYFLTDSQYLAIVFVKKKIKWKNEEFFFEVESIRNFLDICHRQDSSFQQIFQDKDKNTDLVTQNFWKIKRRDVGNVEVFSFPFFSANYLYLHTRNDLISWFYCSYWLFSNAFPYKHPRWVDRVSKNYRHHLTRLWKGRWIILMLKTCSNRIKSFRTLDRRKRMWHLMTVFSLLFSQSLKKRQISFSVDVDHYIRWMWNKNIVKIKKNIFLSKIFHPAVRFFYYRVWVHSFISDLIRLVEHFLWNKSIRS